MEDLYSESDLDMREVCPPVPPVAREAPAAEPGAEAGGGGAEGNLLTLLVCPGGGDFGGSSGSSDSSCTSDDSHISNNSSNSNSNDSEDLPAPVGRLVRDLEVFGELPALQSGRTRSQSRVLAMSASCTDALLTYALLTYAMRTVEAKRTVEEEAAVIERAHNSVLEECLEKVREWLE